MKRCVVVVTMLMTACSTGQDRSMDDIAKDYVRLALQVGQVDADYVDAYYGPDSLRPSTIPSDTAKFLEHLETTAGQLLDQLAKLPTSADEMTDLRQKYLAGQLTALRGRVQILRGRKMTFEEQAAELYQGAPPTHEEAHFKELVAQLDKELPGSGPIQPRLEEFQKKYIIPADKIDTVFKAAIAECRKRTARYVRLPENENFTVEYVTGQPWSGYNWYKGNAFSLIQVNVDLPISIDRAIDLAAHEGYPGHHVYNVLLEKHLSKDRGWIEFMVYPLFSPQSLIAEGSANYGKQVVFSDDERRTFERDVLYPLAGLDSKTAETYDHVQELKARLSYSGNEAARNYLNGVWDKSKAIDWMVDYGLYTLASAEKRIRFIERYGAYVINYNYGEDMVREYVERCAGESPSRETVWSQFTKILSSPQMPSTLRAACRD